MLRFRIFNPYYMYRKTILYDLEHIHSRAFHTILLRDDGEAVAFGDNLDDQCIMPARPAGTRYVAAVAGAYHSSPLNARGGD